MSDVQTPLSVIAPGEFRVGSALSRAMEILIRHFAKFFLIALLAGVTDALKIVGAVGHVSFAGNGAIAALSDVLIGIADFVLYALSQGVALYGAFQEMRGRPFRVSEAFARGLARFLPIIGVSILTSIVVGFGIILLVVPGLMWLTRYYLAVPSCVMESLGPSKSMNRSAELTNGHRWQIFGVLALTGFVGAAPEAAINALFEGAAGSVDGLVASLIWHTVVVAYGSVIVAVMYHDLRMLKDGIDIDRIAAVFD